MQDSQSQADHLQILATGCGGDISRFGSNIVDYGLLQPGHQEVGAFVNYSLFHSRKTVEDHGTGTAFDVVDGSLGEGEADGDGDGVTVDSTESVSHREADGKGVLRVVKRRDGLICDQTVNVSMIV